MDTYSVLYQEKTVGDTVSLTGWPETDLGEIWGAVVRETLGLWLSEHLLALPEAAMPARPGWRELTLEEPGFPVHL